MCMNVWRHGPWTSVKPFFKELSVNDLLRFHKVFSDDGSVKITNDYVCTQKEEINLQWYHSSTENICWPGAVLQPDFDELKIGADNSLTRKVIIVDDPLIRLVKTWDKVFRKNAKFEDIALDFELPIKSVQGRDRYEQRNL